MLDLATLPAHPPPGGGVQIRCIAFDFKEKRDEALPYEALSALGDRFLWIDVAVDGSEAEAEAVVRWLAGAGLVAETLAHDALFHVSTNHLARFEQYLHLVLSACVMDAGDFRLARVDAFVAERYLLTLHRGPIGFLEGVRRDYCDDFKRFAQSPSFLMYELWDHLLEHYVQVQKHFEDRVEELQADLIRDIDDHLFARVSQVGAHLLYFRKVLLPARAVLAELSTRKSQFVSEATQPFLSNMIGTIDRVLQDALVDRDILTQSLNLHMSLVTHQTNRLMNKLTVVSVIFLPLSFLAGVYGMNFKFLPELEWEHGYFAFWGLTAAIVSAAVYLLKRVRLL